MKLQRRVNPPPPSVSKESPAFNQSRTHSRVSSFILKLFRKVGSKARKNSENADIVIAVMGVTGAGKSSFIATATGRTDIQVGHDLYSETSEVKAYHFSHNSTNYILVDTPGFDDSSMSNEDIATKILQWLQSSNHSGTCLNGIIYIHNITKSRMQGSAYRNMRLFRQLCGDEALGNVILATSFWDQVAPSVGSQREQELKNSHAFWAGMVAKGSEVVRIRPDRAVYLEVLERIAAKGEVSLSAQKEMAGKKKTLKRTSAGANTMAHDIHEFEKRLDKEKKFEKKRLKRKLDEGHKAHKKNMRKLRMRQSYSLWQARWRRLGEDVRYELSIYKDGWHRHRDRLRVQEPVWRAEANQRLRRGAYRARDWI